ncbi:MAG: hypothetical protein CMD23_00650 [Flavobacteriales bacterium]|nr:hypothetical protein [Flavobacteriales bacterium]
MKLPFRIVYLFFVFILAYSCRPDVRVPDNTLENQRVCKENYTCIQGTVIDTLDGKEIGLPGAEIRIIPSLLDTSYAKTNESGTFWLESAEFDEDEVYLIRIDMEGYFGNNWTNIRVDMDTLNILNDKVLDKKPEFKGIIDSTYLPGEK